MVTVRAVRVPSEHDVLDADLSLPERSRGLVVFAHGSGSGRRSPRNRFVAESLESAGVGTLLLDLLTRSEAAEDERTQAYRFRIPLLASRLVHTVDWSRKEPATRELPLGLYGASTGGAAALIAAADRAEWVRAVVLRGARSDLADEAAPQVRAPTLFLVGGDDAPSLEANRATARRLAGAFRVTIVPGASHLFEEPGALETVARGAVAWFSKAFDGTPV